MRKILVIVGGVAGAYVGIELLSYFVLVSANHLVPSAFNPVIPTKYYADLGIEDLRDYLDGDYDPLLGWHHSPDSEETGKNCLGETWTESFESDGSRSTPQDYDTTVIASYGDSYVKGGELNNDQTWQFQLAKRISSGVKNYAVGAYGPYQAVLKIKLHIDQGNVFPITVLGINEQNITRVVNLYRPFLYRNVRAKFSFKPGIGCKGTHCIPIENLLRHEVQTIEEVQRIAHEAREWDFWAQTKPALEYSWFLNLAKLTRYAFFVWTADEPEPLWNTPEGLGAMHLVVSDFHDSVRAAGSLPVVLFIPTKPKDGVYPSYRFFKRRITEQFPDLIVLDVADSSFDAKRFKLKPTGACHPSEYGHSVIATTVRNGLQDVLVKGKTDSILLREEN